MLVLERDSPVSAPSVQLGLDDASDICLYNGVAGWNVGGIKVVDEAGKGLDLNSATWTFWHVAPMVDSWVWLIVSSGGIYCCEPLAVSDNRWFARLWFYVQDLGERNATVDIWSFTPKGLLYVCDTISYLPSNQDGTYGRKEWL